MHPMLIEALVAPRADDLRRSARIAGSAQLRTRSSAPAVPVPQWTRALKVAPAAPLAVEPVATGCGDAA